MPDITIGIVASAREWRSLLQAHVRDHVAGVKVQILREPRMALELQLDVVVIDDVSSFLTRDKVVRLRERGTRVVGIYDPDGTEGLGIGFLENLGVDLSLPSNISPEEMINAVSQLQPRESYSHTFDHAVADYSTTTTHPPALTDSTLIAVSGPAGTGSTEIAIALADVLVARRSATLLLDVDEVGPSVARRLGFHLHPNILTAIDTVNNVTRPLTEVVGRPSDRAANSVHFDVIPGIANPEDWTQLRPMDMDDLFAAVKKSWRYVVCNTGPFAEDLSGYGIERFGSTRSTLTAADVIIGVMVPTPTGYMRFLDWLASLRTIGADRAVYVVVNRSPKSNYIKGEIESQLARDVDPRFIAGMFFIPEDEKVTKAEWEGQRVGKGSFLTGIAEIASYVVPMDYKKQSKKSAPLQSYAEQNASGYNSGFDVTQQPASVSWDDPDIVNPPVSPSDRVNQYVQPQPEQKIQQAPEEFFEANHQLPQEIEGIGNESDIVDIQNHLAETMPEPPTHVEPQASVDESNSYSFSPPLHHVEQIHQPDQQSTQSEPSQAQAPQQSSGTYVPGYVQSAPAQTQNPQTTFVQSQPESHTSDYTTQPAEQAQNPQGYVPHFLDEKQEEDENDEKFWG